VNGAYFIRSRPSISKNRPPAKSVESASASVWAYERLYPNRSSNRALQQVENAVSEEHDLSDVLA
jgi:hypothetical protein